MEYIKEFDSNQELYEAIITLEASQWWKLYTEWLKDELAATEEMILSSDEEKNKVQYTWYDINRCEREYLLAMLNFTKRRKDEIKPVIN